MEDFKKSYVGGIDCEVFSKGCAPQFQVLLMGFRLFS